jgi:thiosulfate dehydrogenase [quinone] large subunit
LGAVWWGALRVAIGWIFVWPFVDKLFGLGFTTCRSEGSSDIDAMCDAAFAKGGSPTYGFLEFGTNESHTGDLFSWMAPSSPTSPNIVDWLFMVALLAIGVGLMLGVASRLAALGGAVLLVFMYLAGFVWPEHNPLIDDHLIYALALLGVASTGAGRYLGLGEWWNRLPAVQGRPILQS